MPKSVSKKLKKTKPKTKKNKNNNFRNNPIGHRKSLYGKDFTDCYSKFDELKSNTKSKNPTLKSSREAVNYLKKHLPKCIEIIGEYLLEH